LAERATRLPPRLAEREVERPRASDPATQTDMTGWPRRRVVSHPSAGCPQQARRIRLGRWWRCDAVRLAPRARRPWRRLGAHRRQPPADHQAV